MEKHQTIQWPKGKGHMNVRQNRRYNQEWTIHRNIHLQKQTTEKTND